MDGRESDQQIVVGPDASRPAPWRARSGRPRILVEAPEAHWNFVTKWARSRAPDWEVIVCGGPDAARDCPVVRGEPCPFAEGADAIVAGFGLEGPRAPQILTGLRSRHGDVPIVALTHHGDSLRHGNELDGCHELRFPWTAARLTAACDTLLSERM